MATSKEQSTFKLISDLFKLRLASLVVFSASVGYIFYQAPNIEWLNVLWLSIGGVLVTGCANALNQIIEINSDALMDRTKGRPLPSGNMNKNSAVVMALLAGLIGLLILLIVFNFNAFLLGVGAIVSYAFVYTPMKKVSPWAVFIGAFPGAIPPFLGYVAASNTFDVNAGLLFVTQFMWQFPHFWAIAWNLEEDYNLGGFSLLPSAGGRNKQSAYQILIYTLFVIPIGLLPWAFDMCGIYYAVVVTLLGIYMAYWAFKLYFSCEVKDAKKLMFSSFAYLPFTQILMVIDKI